MYAASQEEEEISPAKRRELDLFAAQKVFNIPLTGLDTTDGEFSTKRLRTIVGQAEREHLRLMKSHDIKPDGEGIYRYVFNETKDHWEYKAVNERLFASILNEADREWITEAQRQELRLLIDCGSEGSEKLRLALSHVRGIRAGEINKRRAQRIGDAERTRQLERGELPTYKHPFEPDFPSH